MSRLESTEPSETPQHRALLALLRTSNAIWDASRVFFSTWGLTAAQFNLMNLLAEAGVGRTQSELGRELLTHRSNVTGLVDRLEARGLVKRSDSGRDRRSWRVALTPEGRKLMDRVRPKYRAAAAVLTSGWSNQRAAEVESALAQLAGAVSAMAGEAGGEERL